MTSPSHKKHQTTLRSIPPESQTETGGRLDVWIPDDERDHSSFVIRHSSFENTWLPAALLATLTLLVGALQAIGGESDLQWRRSPALSRPAAASSSGRTRLIVSDQRDERGYAVVQVAYDDGHNRGSGWSSTVPTQSAGAAKLKSVIVYSNDSGTSYSGSGGNIAQRSDVQQIAQNPFGDDRLPFDEPADEDPPSEPTDDEQLGRELAEPFGLPEMDDLPSEEPEELPEPVEPGAEERLFPDIDLQVQPNDTTREPPPTPREITPAPARDPFERPEEPPSEIEEEPDTAADRDKERKRDEALEKERVKSQESCLSEREELRNNRIESIDLSIAVTGRAGRDYPFECAIDDGSLYAARCWPETTYMWKAAANCHKPLYFEQHHLERYGHSWGPCLQPIVSGAHFFTRLPVLPYCIGLKTPNECVYPLGHYRPGNCAPYMVDPIPFTWRAAIFQAGATVGVVGVLP